VPCGLAVNELVSNCLKYAFPAGRAGVVTLRLARAGEDVLLSVRDDGVGLPGHVELGGAKTFGLRLVAALVRQLRGTAEVRRDGGTGVDLTFPAGRETALKRGTP
jgi:two-component sensor histidine kinase